MERRRFLRLAAGGILVLIGGYFSYQKVSPHVRKYLDFLRAGAVIEVPGAGQTINIFTSNARFFLQSAFGVPSVNLEEWSLSVDGKVENPLSLDYEEVTSLSGVSNAVTMECIGNPIGGNLVGTALWGGVPLRDVLNKARVQEDARKIVFHCAEGYTTSLNLDKALSEETLLVYNMNGEVLPREHGYPLRAAIPGLYGLKWAKWVTRIEVTTDSDYRGYWEESVFSEEAKVLLTSKILKPEEDEKVSQAPYPVIGLSWDSDIEVERVEVSVDGGESWNTAQLLYKPDSPYVWTLWQYPWEPAEKGNYTVTARAIDKSGNIQGERAVLPFPAGPVIRHRVDVEVI